MSIMIREDLSESNSLVVNWNYKEDHLSPHIKESFLVDNPISPDSIMADYEAIHEGVTRNFTDYTREALEYSVKTWTYPYLRPLIMHHNETDGKIIGRIHHAYVSDKNTLSNTSALILTGNIPDKEGKEAIQDGRLKTVSIGAIVHEAFCSICGCNIAEEGPCEHQRGMEYDGKLCTWRITKMEAKELSYVIVPSDIYAQHVKIYKPNVTKKIKESFKGVNVVENQNQPILDENVPTKTINTETKDLEDKVSELKNRVDELETINKSLTKQLEDEKVLKANVEKKLADTQVLLAKANEDIEKVKNDLTTKEAALTKEIALREAAEAQLIIDKQTKRNQLVESVLNLRTQLGKREILKEDLEKKSDEYLQESLADLEDEFNNINFKTTESLGQEKIVNPGIVDKDEEKDTKNVKEQKAVSNMNVEEQLQNLMYDMFATKRY